jgi:phospholipase/lecithinase/hemolysin
MPIVTISITPQSAEAHAKVQRAAQRATDIMNAVLTGILAEHGITDGKVIAADGNTLTVQVADASEPVG